MHNRMERTRRNFLNQLQEELKGAIPELAMKPKASRASVLTEGQTHIQKASQGEQEANNKNKIVTSKNITLLSKYDSLINECYLFGIK